MIDNVKNLKEHLKAQIKRAKKLDSKWVYILKEEAEKCLELAEAEDVIMEMLNERDKKVEEFEEPGKALKGE